MIKDPPSSCSAGLDVDNDLTHWTATILGPVLLFVYFKIEIRVLIICMNLI